MLLTCPSTWLRSTCRNYRPRLRQAGPPTYAGPPASCPVRAAESTWSGPSSSRTDETCFYLLEAASRDDVDKLAERSGMLYERVTEVNHEPWGESLAEDVDRAGCTVSHGGPPTPPAAARGAASMPKA